MGASESRKKKSVRIGPTVTVIAGFAFGLLIIGLWWNNPAHREYAVHYGENISFSGLGKGYNDIPLRELLITANEYASTSIDLPDPSDVSLIIAEEEWRILAFTPSSLESIPELSRVAEQDPSDESIWTLSFEKEVCILRFSSNGSLISFVMYARDNDRQLADAPESHVQIQSFRFNLPVQLSDLRRQLKEPTSVESNFTIP